MSESVATVVVLIFDVVLVTVTVTVADVVNVTVAVDT